METNLNKIHKDTTVVQWNTDKRILYIKLLMRTDKHFQKHINITKQMIRKKNKLFKRYILIKILSNEMMDADNY